MSKYMRYIFALILAVILACGCSDQSQVLRTLVPTAVPAQPAFAILHADTDFTKPERAILEDATKVWRLQTDGVARVLLVYDLDFNSISGLQAHVENGHNLIARMDSDMDSVHWMDIRSGGTVLGWVSPSGGIHNPEHEPIQVAFVVDRFPNRDYALQVVVHEFGHVFGLPHLGSRQSIMYPAVVPGRSACLKTSDLNAFCQVNACGSARLLPCE